MKSLKGTFPTSRKGFADQCVEKLGFNVRMSLYYASNKDINDFTSLRLSSLRSIEW